MTSRPIAITAILLGTALSLIAAMQTMNSTVVRASSQSLIPRAYLPLVSKVIYYPNAGKVRFFKKVGADFDPCAMTPTPELQAWIGIHYWRMLTYPPCFDSRLASYPNAWTYKDLYAVYTNPSHADSRYIIIYHPEWLLKDSGDNQLYINWGCSNGTCPQYAGDIGNPAFRAHWITTVSSTLSQGYLGLFVDDVNMDWRISDGNGNSVTPIDPRTGTLMTLEDWRRYCAEFVEQIRASFPDKEIIHNVIWYAGPSNNQFIVREIQASDYINLERGLNDANLVGGSGQWGVETFLAYVDFVHSHKRHVLFLANGNTSTEREYGLAGWLLISEGNDGFSNEQVSNPDNWWGGYALDLGAGLGSRYHWNSVIRRDFEKGIVLLNQPNMLTRTIQLGQTYKTIDGSQMTDVTLGPARGAILLVP